MLQIKTIHTQSATDFDERVNEALADGWTLARRLTGPDAFVAELERELPGEIEQTCETCKHFELENYEEPCAHCNGDCWEAEA